MLASTAVRVAANDLAKGDVLATARIAGIQAVRQAMPLLTMSHQAFVDNVRVSFRIADNHIDVEASVDLVDHPGGEMEALTAVTVAALTIYDMCKSADRTMTIGEVALWEKSDYRAGVWRRDAIFAAVSDEDTQGQDSTAQ
jgi:cyclic pyranopterin phosphate synthase